jgi:hypothetical protein
MSYQSAVFFWFGLISGFNRLITSFLTKTKINPSSQRPVSVIAFDWSTDKRLTAGTYNKPNMLRRIITHMLSAGSNMNPAVTFNTKLFLVVLVIQKKSVLTVDIDEDDDNTGDSSHMSNNE